MYPPFDADILHYALTCSGSPTLSVAAETERAGAQLTLLRADTADNEASTTGSLNASVTVGGDHDVAIEVSDDGQTRTYVVHCLPDSFPTVNVLTKTDQVSPGLLLVTLGGRFIAVIDNNGVPRFHREYPETMRNFRRHANGPVIGGTRVRYSISREKYAMGTTHLLDEDFDRIGTVRAVSPLTGTDGHDFLVIDGLDSSAPHERNFLVMSYDRNVHDFRPYGGSATQSTRDSVFQEVTPGGVGKFLWNSWDHREVMNLGTDCTVDPNYLNDYAHLNSLQVTGGDIVASFQRCSQVLRIDGQTGAVEWKLGGTAPPADSTTEYLEIVDDPEGEFCGQHHATLTASGSLVLFDNGVQCLGGRKGRPPRTRVVEYDIASATQAAWVRHFRLPEEHGYSDVRGGVTVLGDESPRWLTPGAS